MDVPSKDDLLNLLAQSNVLIGRLSALFYSKCDWPPALADVADKELDLQFRLYGD